MKSRNDQLDALFEDSTKKVKELSGKKDYEKALESLILEVSRSSHAYSCHACLHHHPLSSLIPLILDIPKICGDYLGFEADNSSVQVFLKLLSENVTLTHRKKDQKIINKSSKSAADKYKEMTGRTVSVELESGLNDDEAGGVIGSSMGGKIKVDNTLVERLKILEEKVRRHTLSITLISTFGDESSVGCRVCDEGGH